MYTRTLVYTNNLLFSATDQTTSTFSKEQRSGLTGDEAGVHVCVCTMFHVRSVVVWRYRHIQTARNVLRWLLELALMMKRVEKM